MNNIFTEPVVPDRPANVATSLYDFVGEAGELSFAVGVLNVENS
jgi:hypothetical protein